MSFTRFHDDPHRIRQHTEDSSYVGKYYLNTPSQGSHMPFFEDPQIRLQRWGANMMFNGMNIESDLRGLTRKLNHDSIQNNEYNNMACSQGRVSYSGSRDFLTVDETRSSNPAWLLRGIEIPRWEEPIINPQANVEKRFIDNVQTRIVEKDSFQPTYSIPPPAYPFM